ncbi:MAG: leucine-rich repeat domain-containing protein [Treponema sp.]|jgi:hypothetical protein|nr:leucine-rich repeat domain-containing protein [Treponema sp.]
MNKPVVVLLFTLIALGLNTTAQENDGLVTDFTTEGGTPLVTRGDYVLRDTVLVQYRGDAEEVIIPGDLGITGIGAEVFERANIRAVVIPEGVTMLGSRVFNDCYSLRSVTLPRSLLKIGEEAFFQCRIDSIYLPAELINIGDRAFAGCRNLTAIQVDGANRVFAERDGVLFNKTFTRLIRYPEGKPGSSYTVPEGVTVIGEGAFYRTNLESVTLPGSLTSIGDEAFSWSYNISSINLPAGLNSIGHSVFFWCRDFSAVRVDGANRFFAERDGVLFNKTFTELIVYPGGRTGSNYNVPEGVTLIRDGAFAYCYNLHSINLPPGLTAIGDGAFSGCYYLRSISLPESLTSIGNEAFAWCSSLNSITVLPLRPPMLKGVLHGDWWSWDHSDTVIYVPPAAYSGYRNAEGWKDYANWLRPIGSDL